MHKSSGEESYSIDGGDVFVTRILDSFTRSVQQCIDEKNYRNAKILIASGQGILKKLEEEGLIQYNTFDDYWYKFFYLRGEIRDKEQQNGRVTTTAE